MRVLTVRPKRTPVTPVTLVKPPTDDALRSKTQGLRHREIAELFNLSPADIEALIYGNEPGSGTV
jgi:hypothetical protein